MNRLLPVLDALVETNATRVEIDISYDPQGFKEMIKEVRDMVQEVNDFLSVDRLLSSAEGAGASNRQNQNIRPSSSCTRHPQKPRPRRQACLGTQSPPYTLIPLHYAYTSRIQPSPWPSCRCRRPARNRYAQCALRF
jgi:hypothetical protein